MLYLVLINCAGLSTQALLNSGAGLWLIPLQSTKPPYVASDHQIVKVSGIYVQSVIVSSVFLNLGKYQKAGNIGTWEPMSMTGKMAY